MASRRLVHMLTRGMHAFLNARPPNNGGSVGPSGWARDVPPEVFRRRCIKILKAESWKVSDFDAHPTGACATKGDYKLHIAFVSPSQQDLSTTTPDISEMLRDLGSHASLVVTFGDVVGPFGDFLVEHKVATCTYSDLHLKLRQIVEGLQAQVHIK